MNFIPSYKNSFRILKGGKISLVVSSFLASTTLTFAAPSGGVVTSGSANISQNGKVTDITQSTQKASINWNKFNIASDETVNFKQPNSSSITLNRVVGNEKSIINGALNANGQVWIINSNGVLFGKGASINTSGLLATTKDISDADFQAGNYKFTGNSNESVINLGTIDVVNGGSVILAANEVKNEGTIKAIRGKIHLAGADEYTVNLNGNSLVNLIVNKGVLDALVKNSGTIIANGGEVYLTTNAVNELLKGVVNNTGVIEANSLAGITGHVELFAHGGTANIDGSIIAKDGFVETSGKEFTFNDAKIEAGEWLIDPVNVTIDDSLATAIETQLNNNGDVTIKTETSSSTVDTSNNENGTDGNIYVNSEITWNTAQKLTLDAYNDIFINKSITATNAAGQVALYYGQGAVENANTADYYVKAPINLKAGDNFITKLGSNGNAITWTVVTDAATLRSTIDADKTKNYALGANIDLSTVSATNNWNPIGTNSDQFSGKFDGLGHTISNLHINNSSKDYIGLFGSTSTTSLIKNLHLTNVDLEGKNFVGGLIGYGRGDVSNVSVQGKVKGNDYVGGLIGYGRGDVSNVSVQGKVKGINNVGGVLGTSNSGDYDQFNSLQHLISSVNVTGVGYSVGGLIGSLGISNLSSSYSVGSVKGDSKVGGLVGSANSASSTKSTNIKKSYATGSVSGTSEVGGLVGNLSNAKLENSYSSNSVTGTSRTGGLIGHGSSTDITNSFYDEETNTAVMVDSVLGKTKAEILTAFTGKTGWSVGGGAAVAGYEIALLPYLTSVTKDADKSGVTTLFAGGMGVDGDAYTITNWNQLQNINNANILTKGNFFSLLNDLGATTTGYTIQVKNGATLANDGKGWNPIGYFKSYSDQSLFAGNFDGLGHTVKDLFINRPDDQFNGLFGYIDNSTIKNIGVVNANIQSNNIFGGVLAGGVLNSTIENAYSTGILNISVDDNYWGTAAGGLVGILNNSTINNSYSTVKTTGISKTGGLVGYLSNSSTINNSYATGEVTGTGNNIGGLVGSNTSSSVTNSFWDTQTSGQATSAVGVGKTTAQMQDKSTFDGWDIQEDSTIAKGTPFLAWQKSGNGYTKTWVIGTKGATPPTPNPVDPKPQDTNKGVERIVRSIANQTATTVNLPNMETSTTPNNSGRNTNISFSQGENQMLVSRPIEGQATKRVSLSEARQMQIQNGGSSEEVIVPLSNSSIIQLIDGGVNLPSGVEQEFYLADAKEEK
ncbi:hypothetical protein CJ671_09815 [Aliarcobacter cryaerophilus]|uniref:Filamentous haemagglutinin FhaB/tRNA nuclease CdiA-like TPS domain-containing protein n=1 Tax=Aliarcobacter cryaerophilus TaxID=28198 RepID=A0A2S9SMB5_9BACT|nr:filamentous hemagglutinin N-terminal domain-containing protein [Aliarcobacter cryaerophilus]PRM87726.1 hypothetical protein CJ671_09815 [Aliarcobacter cryaerophilus]